MIIINSTENKNFKLCQQLANRKYRDKLGLYLIEGQNLLNEAFDNGAALKLIVFREKRMDGDFGGSEIKPDEIYNEIKTDKIKKSGAEVIFMSEKLFEKLAQTETSQGVLAIVDKNEKSLEQIQNEIFSAGSNVVVLDRLQDPGNIGTIIRTADGAGYKGVVVLKGTGDVYAPKVVRAAAGSVFRMPVLFMESPAEAMKVFKTYGKKTVSTCFDTENNYYDVDLKKDIALIIGNEGNGICRELIQGSDINIKIPMKGKIESLNAAVAAGIIMYEAIRK